MKSFPTSSMKGDFTRNTFDPNNHFSRVLMQQGRVTLDSDHNEQTSILLHYLRALACDLIGPYAAPVEDGGFGLTIKPAPPGVFTITKGRYYVDGILIENNSDCTYTTQPDYQIAPETTPCSRRSTNRPTATSGSIWMSGNGTLHQLKTTRSARKP